VIESSIILLLISVNGLFALSELAVVSSRHARLKSMAAANRRGARAAVQLASNPGRFLSAVQIGITLVGIVNGAYSGETFGEDAAELLATSGMLRTVADPVGYGAVLLIVTYLSVIVGELVPKSLALRNPEVIACAVAPYMMAFAKVAGPAVWLLDASTRLVFRVLGQAPESETRVTDEEIRTLIAEAEAAGVIEKSERSMIAGVMRLADRTVIGIMTPRIDVEWLDLAGGAAAMRTRLMTTQHSRLPAGEGSADAMVGIVQTRELLAACLGDEPFDVLRHVRPAPVVPESRTALDILQLLREAELPMALVHDEYGHFVGLVTPADILEAIAGVFRSDLGDTEPYATQRKDGTWLFSGAMPADEMADTLEIVLPAERSYATVAGLVTACLQHLPEVGESTVYQGWRLEVVDLDGRRIDKVLATKLPTSHRAHD
jgi:putative hemolysin